MYLKYSIGFLIASLSQAIIILTTESLGISTLGAKLTVAQLLTHIIAGQIIGYILLFIMRKLQVVGTSNVLTIGVVSGVVTWLILLSINSTLGKVKAPWTQGPSTVLSSMIAFMVFGIIATYAIRKYGYNKIS